MAMSIKRAAEKTTGSSCIIVCSLWGRPPKQPDPRVNVLRSKISFNEIFTKGAAFTPDEDYNAVFQVDPGLFG